MVHNRYHSVCRTFLTIVIHLEETKPCKLGKTISTGTFKFLCKSKFFSLLKERKYFPDKPQFIDEDLKTINIANLLNIDYTKYLTSNKTYMSLVCKCNNFDIFLFVCRSPKLQTKFFTETMW